VDNPFKSPSIISFCPGILGIERGLKRAGVNPRVVAYVEIEAYICANLVAGMEAGILDPAPIWTDAKTFDARPFRGRIHGIIGGYPCTPFSLAGTRSGEDHPGHIYPSISRAIEASRPIWCLFENVAAHLTLGFDKVYQDLQRMGYNVEVGIYTAEEVGAPHERERLFILAISNTYLRSGNSGAKRMGWETWPNLNWCSTKSDLANASRELQHRGWDERRRWDEHTNSSQKLDDTNLSEGRQNITTRNQRNGNNTGREEKTGRLESSGEESVANIISARLEGFGLRKSSAESEFTLLTCFSGNQFPARPGQQQYDWEEPRTIESGVGCSIDGYNFREDLLRALGNSVVEQTAELAFIDLIKKHLKNMT
jgi:site-specific DNA-cytosine methylase